MNILMLPALAVIGLCIATFVAFAMGRKELAERLVLPTQIALLVIVIVMDPPKNLTGWAQMLIALAIGMRVVHEFRAALQQKISQAPPIQSTPESLS